jgi:hypothetical protein
MWPAIAGDYFCAEGEQCELIRNYGSAIDGRGPGERLDGRAHGLGIVK